MAYSVIGCGAVAIQVVRLTRSWESKIEEEGRSISPLGPVSGQESELGRRRVEQNRSSKERESVGEKAGLSCFALTWATAGGNVSL